MSAARKPELTPDQAVIVEAARWALEASQARDWRDHMPQNLGRLETVVGQLLGLVGELTGETPTGPMCAAGGAGGHGGGGLFTCTLGAGHEGRHEAHGASPLPVWDDGDTAVEYDAGGTAEYIGEDGEGQYRNRMACGDSLWDFEEHAEGTSLHCPRHGATVAITEEQWLSDHPAEPIGFLAGEEADDEPGGGAQ